MNNQPLLKTALKYGAIAGLANFVFFLLIYFMSKNPLGGWSWAGIWISIIVIIMGTKFHRNNDLGGYMTYGRGLGIGMLITLFSTILFCLLIQSFGTLIDASLLEMQKNEILAGMQAMEENKESMIKFMGESKFDLVMTEMQKAHDKMTMVDVSFSQFEVKVVGGFIYSLIISAFLRKKRPMFEEQPSSPTINN